MARPVVASCVGGLGEVVLDGETGILVEPGDSHAIAKAVIWLLENPKAAVKMGQNGYYRARIQFNWDRCVNNFENLYRQVKKGC
jgi:glycosyltransferase involved in cell wall biosynthesis